MQGEAAAEDVADAGIVPGSLPYVVMISTPFNPASSIA